MDVRRAPGVVVVTPGIFARTDRGEAVAALAIGQSAPAAGEIRVERSVVLVGRMGIAAGGVGLPDLDQRVRHRLAVLVQYSAAYDDPLADRLPFVLSREI